MKGHLFNIDNGYLEGLCRGFKNGILKQGDYLNLVQCETLEGETFKSLRPFVRTGPADLGFFPEKRVGDLQSATATQRHLGYLEVPQLESLERDGLDPDPFRLDRLADSQRKRF
jgi:hypothetical protein